MNWRKENVDGSLHRPLQPERQGKRRCEHEEMAVKSVDTDQWMHGILAIGTGCIPVDGPSRVDVTVARHVKSATEYVQTNRVYQAILDLSEESSRTSWPRSTVGQRSPFCLRLCTEWVCDILPAIFKCLFLMIWETLLRGWEY